MEMFFLGFAAFAGLSFVVNMFDPDFREALARALLGLIAGPFFLVALVLDRYFPKARKVSPEALQRFAARSSSAWNMAYRNHGVIVVRGRRQNPQDPDRTQWLEPATSGDLPRRPRPYADPKGAS